MTDFFEPIAIVGRACHLPGADSPEELFAAISLGSDLTSDAPAGRWRLNADLLTQTSGPDGLATRRGGYVKTLPHDPRTAHLDPIFKLALSSAEKALKNAGVSAKDGKLGAIFGNLSYPSSALSALSEAIWQHAPRSKWPDLANRNMSSGPASLLKLELGLEGPVFALDAACASSLYAIKFACDALHDHRADLMLAGAVNCADDLFIHMGFTALKALSPTGQSRPFSQRANGLLPGEGAGFVVLERLRDAYANGHHVYGVLRGIGLSNDGRQGGFLAPSKVGQVRAIRSAYLGSSLTPNDVQLIECHATGTKVGDITELQSIFEVFGTRSDLLLGSLKSNMGHLITAAGVAGLIKILEGFRTLTIPRTRDVEEPVKELGSYQLATNATQWTGTQIAALSAFGFGGNNAHVLVTNDDPGLSASAETAAPLPRADLVVCGLGVVAGSASNAIEFRKQLEKKEKFGQTRTVSLPQNALRFPPKDLSQTLPQQIALLQAALEAAPNLEANDRAGVFVGMETDPAICRYGLRWRSIGSDSDLDAIIAPLESAGVVGCMPNVVANRSNAQFGLGGESSAISSKNAGLDAFSLAVRAIRAGELELALVGAADFRANEIDHTCSSAASGDAAVCLILAKRSVAIAKNLPIWASLIEGSSENHSDFSNLIPNVGAAQDLLFMAAHLCSAKPGECYTVNSKWQLKSEGFFANTSEIKRISRPAHAAPPPHTMARAPKLPEIILPQSPISLLNEQPQEVPEKIQNFEQGPIVVQTHSVLPEPSKAPSSNENSLLNQRVPLMSASSDFPFSEFARAHQQFLQSQELAHLQFLAFERQAQALLLSTELPETTTVSSFSLPCASNQIAQVAELPTPIEVEANSAELKQKPVFDKEALQIHANGALADIFGSEFASIDAYKRRVRMPCPPLLLADRVTAIEGEPGCMGKGRMGKGCIETETDVIPGAWYCNQDHMAAGVMIESGQADLFLISYLGVDFLNRGERIYRLLACDLTYHGGLPKSGDTLHYKIDVDGHANHGDVRLFFFHYDCTVNGEKRLSVRQGQAGFFTDDELDASAGVLWDPPEIPNTPNLQKKDAIKHLVEGHPWLAFEDVDLHRTQTHSRTPRLPGGNLCLVQRIVDARDTYLKAEWRFSPNDWFFKGHFFNDPCMPGTLMFEGCLQSMAALMIRLGLTCDRDGWRFEPVPDRTYPLRCRAQATPESKLLTYEIFLEEVQRGDDPAIFASLLVTIDGRKAFYAKGLGLHLVPDWPHTNNPNEPLDPRAFVSGSHRFDKQAMLSAAQGKPSSAFGPMYAPFDSARRVARLPGEPYCFMTRATSVNVEPGTFAPGAHCVIEYEVPENAWYFSENHSEVMPFAVLLEVALQPCGWLASYVGSALTTQEALSFRNLDGDGVVHREITKGNHTLRTEVTLTKISTSGAMIIQAFDVRLSEGDDLIYDFKTVFGFFPDEALRNQVGLPQDPRFTSLFESRSEFALDLKSPEAKPYFEGSAKLARPMLCMIDRITGFWANGGAAQLGSARAEKDVDPGEWFFKAHFFQDPVQPGSLGLEALLDLLQWLMLKQGFAKNMSHPRFEPIASQIPMTWRYRGQVIPENRVITTVIELTKVEFGENQVLATADASLFVDGKRIYEAKNLALRLVEINLA